MGRSRREETGKLCSADGSSFPSLSFWQWKTQSGSNPQEYWTKTSPVQPHYNIPYTPLAITYQVWSHLQDKNQWMCTEKKEYWPGSCLLQRVIMPNCSRLNSKPSLISKSLLCCWRWGMLRKPTTKSFLGLSLSQLTPTQVLLTAQRNIHKLNEAHTPGANTKQHRGQILPKTSRFF